MVYLKTTVPKEVKEEILLKVKAGESAASVAEKFGISVRTIYGWLRRTTTNKVSWMEHIKLKKENQQLKEIIGVLSLEVAKSKKRQAGREIKAKLPSVSPSLISKSLGIPKRSLFNPKPKQGEADLILKDQILKVLELNPGYGHRRLALGVGKKRTRRVMRLYGIKPYKRKGRWIKKKDYGNPPSKYLNLIKGSCPIKPNIAFAGDFTRLGWNGKIIYLATFMDIFTREIAGWSVSTKHTTEFVIEAYLDAVKTVGRSIIVHTDQGSEYNSEDYTKFMESLGVQISMSKKGSPWENGYQESWYDNFKTDLGLEFERFETIGEFVEGIHRTVNYYNKERIHTALKMSPVKFKLKFLQKAV